LCGAPASAGMARCLLHSRLAVERVCALVLPSGVTRVELS